MSYIINDDQTELDFTAHAMGSDYRLNVKSTGEYVGTVNEQSYTGQVTVNPDASNGHKLAEAFGRIADGEGLSPDFKTAFDNVAWNLCEEALDIIAEIADDAPFSLTLGDNLAVFGLDDDELVEELVAELEEEMADDIA